MDERKALILQVLVEEYIRTGEPVSSKTITERSGLSVSSATVRNDLARLEDEGFVAQPHTSAGRTPTALAYRYYIDHCAPGRLRSATLARIEAFFSGVHSEISRLLKDTSNLLADVSRYPAVVLGPGIAAEPIRALHLLQVSDRTLLVIVVTEMGRVSQEIARIPDDLDEAQLAAAEELLAQEIVGKQVDAAPEVAEELPTGTGEAIAGAVRAVAAAVVKAEDSTREVYLGGTSRLAALWQDIAVVHRILQLLEREASLLAVLDDHGDGTSVRLGSELDLDGVDLAVVSTQYEAPGHGLGRLGVLGPMRMDYRRTIRVVEEVRDNLGESLGH